MSLWPLLNTLQFAFIFGWTGLWITLALLVSVVTRSRRLPLAMARRVWAPGIVAVAGARLEIRGLELLDRGEAYYFASNHQSLGDIPVLYASLPFPLRFIAKRELARIPFLGWYIRAMGMVTIDRKIRTSGFEGIHRAAELLREGAAILSFPEGTRSRDGAVGRFKTAGFVAPIEAGAPVVPVALWGVHEVLPPRTFRLRPGTIGVGLGRPIPTEGLDPRDRMSLARECQHAVEELQRELRAEISPSLSSPAAEQAGDG